MFLLVNFNITSISMADPIVEEIFCNPPHPEPLSNVTFTVGINNKSSDIEEVCLIF